MLRRRLANLLDPACHAAARARRRVVARVCAGQGVEQIARLEGIPVGQAKAILAQPVMLALVAFWRWLLGCVRTGRGAEAALGMGRRFLDMELETGNHWIANLYARLLLTVGDPGRGIMGWVAGRLERLAARNMVRAPRQSAGRSEAPERPAPTDEELFLREERQEMLAEARHSGMHGGLDLRRLPHDWSRGVAASLFDQLCGVLEAAAPYLVPAAEGVGAAAVAADDDEICILSPAEDGQAVAARFGGATIVERLWRATQAGERVAFLAALRAAWFGPRPRASPWPA